MRRSLYRDQTTGKSEVSATSINNFARGVPQALGRIPALQYLLRLALTLTLYLCAGKLGLLVPFTNGNVSPVFPAAGVALAAVLLFGSRVWPAITLGAFLVNFWSPVPMWSALGLHWGTHLALLWVAISSGVLPDSRFPFQGFGMLRVSSQLRWPVRLRPLRRVARPYFSHAYRRGLVFGRHGGFGGLAMRWAS